MCGIYFITDQRPGEPDILTAHQYKPLLVRSIWDGRELARVHPSERWTHELLVETGEALEKQFEKVFREDGADAYLGDQYVGSTEC